jgi:hypothetical protein
LVTGLYDEASLETWPFGFAISVRIEEGGLLAELHLELNDIADLHDTLRIELLKARVVLDQARRSTADSDHLVRRAYSGYQITLSSIRSEAL